MSKPLLLSFLLISLLWSCQNKPTEVVKQEPLPQRPYQMPAELQEIGKFADVTFADTTELQQAFTFKAVDEQGKISIIHFEAAAQLYKKLLKSNQAKRLPIFELNDSDKVILMLNGRGFGGMLWAKVLVDRKSKLILMAEFGQEAESDDYAAELTEKSFADQFIGKKISFDGNTFGLSKAGKSLIIGQSEIDGISGASVTSRGTIDMMNTGLSSYLAYLFEDDQIGEKAKEVGIRKILGASVKTIFGLLSKDFLQLVLLSVVLAAPVAWYFSERWLENYIYRIQLEWWIFALAGMLALGIAFLTVSLQSITAALANPIDALRDE